MNRADTAPTGPARRDASRAAAASDGGEAAHAGDHGAGAQHGAADVLVLAVPSRGAGYGGTISARLFVLPMLAIRVVGGIRQGFAISSDLTSATWTFGGGLAVHVLRATPAERFGLGLRADALGEYQTITWQTFPPVPEHTVLFAVDAAVEATYLLLPDVEGVLGGGGEYDYARERDAIQRPGLPPMSMPNLRGFVEAGIRIRF